MKLTTVLMPLLAVTALASGCASTEPRYERNDQTNVRSIRDRSFGVVESIEPGRGDGSDSALLGTVVGGVVGAAAGHQVGEGRTNDIATVAGAVGGAVVGRKIDQAHDRNNQGDTYRIGVRLDDGSRETFTEASVDGLRVGDRIQIGADGIRRL